MLKISGMFNQVLLFCCFCFYFFIFYLFIYFLFRGACHIINMGKYLHGGQNIFRGVGGGRCKVLKRPKNFKRFSWTWCSLLTLFMGMAWHRQLVPIRPINKYGVGLYGVAPMAWVCILLVWHGVQ